jgi:hypothetical protein
MNLGIWRDLGDRGGTFWPQREILTFKVPAAYQNTVVFHTGVKKIPPKFDTLFATHLEVVRLFKGLTAQRL